MSWRVTEWRGEGGHYWLGQLCQLQAPDAAGSMIGEVVELEADPAGDRLRRVRLRVRALRTTVVRMPSQIEPIMPKDSVRLVGGSDFYRQTLIGEG